MNQTGDGHRTTGASGHQQPTQSSHNSSGSYTRGGGGGQYNSHQLSVNNRHYRDWEQGHEHTGANRGGRRGWRPSSAQAGSGSGNLNRGSGNVNDGSDHFETGSEYKRRHHFSGNRHHYGQQYHHNHMHHNNQYSMNNKSGEEREKGGSHTPASNNNSKFFMPKTGINDNGNLNLQASGPSGSQPKFSQDGQMEGLNTSTGFPQTRPGNVRDETDLSNSDATGGATNGLSAAGVHRQTPTMQPFHPPLSTSIPTIDKPQSKSNALNSNRGFENQSIPSSSSVPSTAPNINPLYFPPTVGGNPAVPQMPLDYSNLRLTNIHQGSTGIANSSNVIAESTLSQSYMVPQQMWSSQYHIVGDPMGRSAMMPSNQNWMPVVTPLRQVYQYSQPMNKTASTELPSLAPTPTIPPADNSGLGQPVLQQASNGFGGQMQLLDIPPLLLLHQRQVALQNQALATPPQYDESKRGENPDFIAPVAMRMKNVSLMKILAVQKTPLVLPRYENSPSSSVEAIDCAPFLGDENLLTNGNQVNSVAPTCAPPDVSKEETTNSPPPPSDKSSLRRIYSMEFMYSLKSSPLANIENILLREALHGNLAPSTPVQFQPTRNLGSGIHSRRKSLGSQTAQTPSPVVKGASPKQLENDSNWIRNRSGGVRKGGDAVPPGAPMRQTPTNLSRVEVIKRRVKNLLNKMTVERFTAIADGIAEILEGIEKEEELKQIVDEVYMKAVSEPDFSEMYTDLVLVLRARSPQFLSPAPNFKPFNFQRGIVARCQEEFEHIKNFSSTDLPEDLLATMSEEDIENERKKRKKRTLGNMRFIGELFMRRVLSGLALKQILYSLVEVDNDSKLGTEATPEPHLIECICELLTTIGYNLEVTSQETLETLCSTLDAYKCLGVFEKRIHYKIQDVLDLRANKWRQKLVHRTKAKALHDIRCELATDIEVVGLESDYPYKAYVHEWNNEWHQKRKEERANNTQGKGKQLQVVTTPPATTPDEIPKATGSKEISDMIDTSETMNHATQDGFPSLEVDLRSKLLKSCRQALSAADKEIFLESVEKLEDSKEQEQLEAVLRVLGEDESDPQGNHIPDWISEAVGSMVSDQSIIHFENAIFTVLESLNDFACDKPTAPLCFARFFARLIQNNKFKGTLTNMGKKFSDTPELKSFWDALATELTERFGGSDEAQKKLNEYGLSIKVL